MKMLDMERMMAALDAVPQTHPGPGGVAGVVFQGKVVAARAWGHADVTTGQPMTTATRLPICSISKQFTCGVLLDRLGDPDRLDDRVAAYLPNFTGPLPTIRQLCHNQSGLRDYWALTILHGALAEQEFARAAALPLIARMKTGHFPPGTGYSYCNCNFRILSEVIEAETGQTLEALYADTIWKPAGMRSAVLTADTRQPADDVVGYEGNEATGFLAAENGVYWIGDAGISAALDDMLAYEAWIDTTRTDPESLYARLSRQPQFADGTPARYGFGIAHEQCAGVSVTGHGGALRGFRAQRMHAADARLSVVVMFNHEANAHSAAADLLGAALGHKAPPPAPISADWAGQWLCPQTGLLARISTGPTTASLRFATGADVVTAMPDGTLGAPDLRLEKAGTALVMQRGDDNLTTRLEPLAILAVADGSELSGRYHAAELDAGVELQARDGALHARFDGMVGTGRWERVHPAGADIWTLATRRSMDAPAPGDWTLRVVRDAASNVTGLSLGCWLARNIAYQRVG